MISATSVMVGPTKVIHSKRMPVDLCLPLPSDSWPSSAELAMRPSDSLLRVGTRRLPRLGTFGGAWYQTRRQELCQYVENTSCCAGSHESWRLGTCSGLVL